MSNTKLSLFELFLFMGDLSDDKKYNDLLEQVGLMESVNNETLKSKCNAIGDAGWVICPFWKMDINKNETILDTWLSLINSQQGNSIANYYIEDNFCLLKDIINRMRFDFDEKLRDWFNEAVTNFFEMRYLSCSLILTVLIERVIRDMPTSIWRRKVIKFFENTIKFDIEKIEEKDRADKLNIFFEKNFYVLTLEKFLSNYYALKDYPFERGIEPDFLVRDWLVHGMTNKKITDIECIKLFNALSTLIFLINNLKREEN